MCVSVVVPTYRRPELLDRCLAALAAQEFDPSSFEVIVADDAASDATRRQVEGWADATRPPGALHPGDGHAGAGRGAERRLAIGPQGRSSRSPTTTASPTPAGSGAGVAAFEAGSDADAATGRVVVPLPDDPDRLSAERGGARGRRVRHGQLLRPSRGPARRSADSTSGSPRPGARTATCTSTSCGPGGGSSPPRRPSWSTRSGRRPGGSASGSSGSRSSMPCCTRSTRDCTAINPAGPALGLLREPWPRLVAAVAGAAAGSAAARAVAGLGSWLWLTGRFCARRLRRTSRSPRHVPEMIVTSALIPPLSVFWRLYGA